MEEENTKKKKQKREIKKIEDKKDLRITLAKRKCSIYKKASELTTLCGAKVDMLMRTSSGNWFSYGEPSLHAMTGSSDHKENPTKDVTDEIVEDHNKSEVVELREKNKELVDQLHQEEKRENELAEILKTRNTCGWWEAKIEDLSCEQAKETEESFVEFKKKLEHDLSIKHGGKDKSSHVNEVKLCATNCTSGSSIGEVVFGANHEACGTIANESILPEISFSPINNGEIFTFYPYGERREDLFDIVYPPTEQTKQARANNFFFNDPNESAGFASFSTEQTHGLNLIDANGSDNHTHDYSSSIQSQGNNPFLPNAE